MNKPKVLYVDDEEMNLSSFRMIFGEFFSIELAGSGSEALDLLERNEFDVIVSDQRMPDMTGLELIQTIVNKNIGTVCIILTAYSDDETMIRAINQGGVYRFLLKPWNKDELQHAITQAADKYRIEKENKDLLEHLRKKNIELDMARKEAEKSNQLKTAFLQNMSHEIRTPLNGIVGFAELLSSGTVPPEKFPDFASIITESGFRLLNIVNDVLDLSKIETGQVDLKFEDINVQDLFMQLYAVYNPKAKEKGIDLRYFPGTEQPIVFHSDKTRLNQILNNLLSNALKFTIEGFIEFGYHITENQVNIYVKDSGVGLHKEEHALIFDRFYRVESDLGLNAGGTGLGLPICHRLAEILGGSIELESEVGQGSVFTVSLPFDNEHTEPETAEIQPVAELQASALTKVLIVEDEMVNSIFLGELLKGISLEFAKNGKEAVEIIKSQKDINFILMDVKMPVMDGYTATKTIKELRPEIPIIMQTAYAMEQDKAKALKCGCDGYISKPINRQELINKMNTLLTKNSNALS